MQYRSEIDGLRAIAVIPVIFFHAGFEWFQGGYVGVDVFFVISGYLITSIIIADLDEGRFRISQFYERRVRRILPALLLVVTACIPFAWIWLLPSAMKDFSQSLLAVATFSSNILFWIESGYFDAAAELKPLLHTWSLAVEEQYYVIFPLLLVAITRFGSRRSVLIILGILFIASLSTADWQAYNSPLAAFFLLASRGWELLLGVFVAYWLRYRGMTARRQWADLGSLIGMALILIATVTYTNETPFPGMYALVPTLGTAMIILFAIPGTSVHKILSNRFLVGIGLVSYSAYLWHQPMFAFAKYRSPTEPSFMLMFILCLLVVPLSYLSWRYVEVPFRTRQFINTRTVVVTTAVASAAIMVAGAIGHKANGFSGRIESQYSGIATDVAEQFSSSFRYVGRNWAAGLELSDFDNNPETRNIILIGDSYAKDLLNAVYESSLASEYSISVHHISRKCGNVWTDKDLSAHIAASEHNKCSSRHRYSDPRLLDLMRDADEVWLASSWQPWHLAYLEETVERITGFSDAQLRVFGRKNFGDSVSFYNYLDVTKQGEKPYIVEMSEQHLQTNQKMKSLIDIGVFIDLSALLCGDAPTCENTTPDGLVISYDGRHLTQAGAGFLGAKLAGELTP